jgi:sugar lactone lactonase YvrE/ketosteroid isomerase-like protein
MTLFLLLALAMGTAPDSGASMAGKSNTALVREARQAYDRGEKALFLSLYEELARRRPGDVAVLYNLACGQSINGRGDAAVRTLENLLAHRVASNLDGDTDFESIRQTEGYRRVAARMNELRQERISSGAERAFTIPEKGLVAEGVAWDPVSKSFFVSSVRRRKIFRIDASGKASDFVTSRRDGIRGALGIHVDGKRRTLWAASLAGPSMDGFREGDSGAPAVFEYDVDTARLRKEHVPPSGGDAPAFDDLTVAPDGTVYVNDGANPRIWRIAPGESLEVFLTSDQLGGTQGLAVSGDGRTLYVSDYRQLYAVDLASRAVSLIGVPSDLALNGIDGLAWFDHGLVAVQNGIVPHRVIRLDLTPDGLRIAKARILEMNHPDFDEPTLGVVVDHAFYFSADSQGQKFQNAKNPIAAADMRESVILKVPLARALATAAPASGEIGATLQRQTQELLDALASGAAPVWERYLDPEVRFVDESGKVAGKKEMVEGTKPLPAGVSGVIRILDFDAAVHGDTAVTTYIADEDEIFHGHKLHCQYRSSDTWKKTPEGWRLIASQIMALRTDPPAITLTANQRQEYCGKYSLAPDIAYEIRCDAGKLEGQQSGRKPEPLLAEAPDVLFVPGKPRYRKVFQRGPNGRITGFAERREAWDIVWRRLDAR